MNAIRLLCVFLLSLPSFIVTKSQTAVYDFEYGSLYYRILSQSDSTIEVAGGNKSDNGTIVIPDQVTHGDMAYYVVSIADNAFKGHEYRSGISFGKHVKSIGKHAFAQIPSLYKVVIPDNIQSIGEGAFYYCSHLSSIHIGAGIDTIPKDAFWGSAVNDLVIGSNVSYIGECAFLGLSGKLKSISLPASVKHVGKNAFSHHMYVTSLDMGQVEELEEGAFDGLLSLAAIHLPASVKEINGNPFTLCGSTLRTVTVSPDNEHFYSPASCNAIISRETNYAVSCFVNTILPEGVLGIDRNAMKLGNAVRNMVLYLPSTIKVIKENEFPMYLDKIVIPDLRNWYNIAFYSNPLACAHRLFVGDEEVTEIEVPEDVTKIYSRCFEGMKNLKRVKFHSKITDIYFSAFYNCPNIIEVDCDWDVPPIVGGTTFSSSVYENATLKIPYGRTSYYKYKDYWSLFKTIEEKGLADEIRPVQTIGNSKPEMRGAEYNLNGQRVNRSVKGLIIYEGRKILRKFD